MKNFSTGTPNHIYSILFHLSLLTPLCCLPFSPTLFKRAMEPRTPSACCSVLCLYIHPTEGMKQWSGSCLPGCAYFPHFLPLSHKGSWSHAMWAEHWRFTVNKTNMIPVFMQIVG